MPLVQSMRCIKALLVMYLVLAGNYTETSALPDCLRMMDAPFRRLPWATDDDRERHAKEIMRVHGHNQAELDISQKAVIGSIFAAWVLIMNLILS